MKNILSILAKFDNEDGAAGVYMIGLIILGLAFSALAIDVGYLYVTRNELQNAADAAALAATRQLGIIYEGQHLPYDISSSQSVIIAAARNTAQANAAASELIATVLDSDIVIGKWDQNAKTVTPTPGYDDAVRVTVRRDASANGKVATFFAGIIGITNLGVTAQATAALSAQSNAEAGGIPVPVGISYRWWADNQCDDPIQLYPTGCPGAGWHDYDATYGKWCKENPDAKCLKDIITGIGNGDFTSPFTEIGNRYFFTGGEVNSAMQYFADLFEIMKIKNDGVLDKDDNSETWTTTAVVYDDSLNTTCKNSTEDYPIVGFATLVITSVIDVGKDKQIDGVVSCNYVDPARGGGGEYGTMGSIPGLVQ